MTTWESWWEVRRIEILARSEAGTPQPAGGPTREAHLDAEAFAAGAWPHLLGASRHRQVFVAESALVALARAAATDAQRSEARQRMLEGLAHRNHLVARCCALGLGDVADGSALARMVEVARDPKVVDDVRVFLALTLASRQAPEARQVLENLVEAGEGGSPLRELAAAGIFGLGSLQGGAARGAADLLRELAFSREGVPPAQRALAVTALGRLAGLLPTVDALLGATSDRDRGVRRAAVAALGRLREVAVAVGSELAAPTGRRALARLREVLKSDEDAFTRRLAAVAIGRLVEGDPPEEAEALRAAYRGGGPGLREFALLGLALAADPSARDLSEDALASDDPSTRAAGCVTLGLVALRARAPARLGSTQRAALDARLCKVMEGDAHPLVRAYAALAVGMVGTRTGGSALAAFLAAGRTPEETGYALLGLGLAGRPGAAEAILEYVRPDMMRSGVVASHVIYALGLTKDRSRRTLETLTRLVASSDDMYVAAAAAGALGYLAMEPRHPERHRLGAVHDYTLDYDFLHTYVLMI